MLMTMRSKLFVPGSRPELFGKALASKADALSFDLEDAVAESRKSEAREQIAQFLDNVSGTSKKIIVRTNHVATSHFAQDVRAVARNGLDILNLPKVESPDEIRSAIELLEKTERESGVKKPIAIIANIESPKGLRAAACLAATDRRVIGLQIGYGDLFSPLGMDRRDAASVQAVMFAVRMAAGEAGIFALDGAFTDVADLKGFAAEAGLAKRMGYIGKSCIHPTQIDTANLVFRPSREEIQHAVNVLERLADASTKHLGAFVVDGKMVDAPLFEHAQKIVAQARQEGLIE